MSMTGRLARMGTLTAAIAAALLVASCSPPVLAETTMANQAAGGDVPHTITVVGRGEVQSQPDVARFTVGIEVTSSTVSEAMSEAKTKMNDIVKAIKAQGIADPDIQTSNFSINVERTPAQPSPSIATQPGATVYHVNNMVQVTVRVLDKVSTVLDSAVSAGANNVWGVTFGLENTTTQESEARAKAIDDARIRAESLAKLSGVPLGSVVQVSEVISSGSIPMLGTAKAMGGGGGSPVQSGELTYSTQIQVVYAIQ